MVSVAPALTMELGPASSVLRSEEPERLFLICFPRLAGEKLIEGLH